MGKVSDYWPAEVILKVNSTLSRNDAHSAASKGRDFEREMLDGGCVLVTLPDRRPRGRTG